MTQAEREMEIRRKLDEASERSKPQYVGEDADEAYSGEDADDDYYFEDDDIILLDDEYDWKAMWDAFLAHIQRQQFIHLYCR